MKILFKKNWQRIWSIQKNVITLHLQTERNDAESCVKRKRKNQRDIQFQSRPVGTHTN